MSGSACARGDFVIEVRSLSPSAHSVGSSYWVREVGAPERPPTGPFATFPDASGVALALARLAGTRAWRRVAVYLEDGAEPTLELLGPAAMPGSTPHRRPGSSSG
jgi:hypothetical protein